MAPEKEEEKIGDLEELLNKWKEVDSDEAKVDVLSEVDLHNVPPIMSEGPKYSQNGEEVAGTHSQTGECPRVSSEKVLSQHQENEMEEH